MKGMQRVPADHEIVTMITAEKPVGTKQTIFQVTQPKRMTMALVLLSSCIALLMTGFGIIVPVFPQRLEALGLGTETLALMESAFGLGMFLCSSLLGTLADHIGRKPIILISLAGFIVTNLVLGTMNIPLFFILIRFVEGAMISGLMPASIAMVGDSVPREKQSRWIGFIIAAQAVGFALGPGIGGMLYQAWGFSCPFFISATIACIAFLLAFIMLPETLSEQVRAQAPFRKPWKRQDEKGSHDTSAHISAQLWAFLPLLIIDCGMTFIYPFVLPQYPFFFARILGYSATQFGVMVSVYGLAMAAFPVLLGRLSEVFSQRLLIILGSVLYSALNGGMLFLHQYVLLIGTAIVTGIENALLIPALSTIYLGKTTEQNRSQIMGIRGTALSLGIFLGPLAQAVASPWITSQTTFAIGIVLSLVMTLLAFVVLKR